MTDHFDHPWHCVGRVEDIPGPGAWLRAPLTRAGVLVTRASDGKLRAFHAVCTHRGSALFELSAPEEGTAARFTCPYHHFEFELDGRACAQVADLAPVRIDTAHGFVFVSLDDAAPPLADALGEVPPWLTRADLARTPLQRAYRLAYDVAAPLPVVVARLQEWLQRASAEAGSLSGTASGRPFLVPEEDRRVVHDAMRLANLLTRLQPDYLLTFVLFPLGPLGPLGTDRTRVVASTCVHADAPDGSFEDVITFWARVHGEDRIACNRR